MGWIETTLRVMQAPLMSTRSIDPKDPNGLLTGARPDPVADGRYSIGWSEATVEECLTIPAVFRALSIITTNFKQLKLVLYTTVNGVETKVPETAATYYGVLKTPDPYTTRAAFFEGTVMALGTLGNAYWKVTRDNRKAVAGLQLLKNQTVKPLGDAFGNTNAFEIDGKRTDDEIYHLKHTRVVGKVEGLGPLQAAAGPLKGALLTQQAAQTFFDRGGVPPGLLTTDNPITPEQADYFKKEWREKASARNGVGVLGNGLKFQLIGMTAEQAQWIGARHFDIAEVARLFGVSASDLLAPLEGSTQTYQNIQQAAITFNKNTLQLYAIEIQDALTKLLPRGSRVEFDFSPLLLNDTPSTMSAYKTAVEAGLMTADEARARLGLGLDPFTDAQRAEVAARLTKAAPAAAATSDGSA